jgi:hypothetical protein
MVVDFAAEESFENAAKRLLLHHGITLSSGCIRKITYRHAKQVCPKPAGTQGALPLEGEDSIILEMDGSMVPIVSSSRNLGSDKRKNRECNWKEFRLCAAQVKGKVHAHYALSSKGVCDAGYCWAKSALDAGWAINTQLHAVADGAEWIHLQWQQNFSKQGRYLVDFYHVCEYLAAAQPTAGTHPRWLEVQKKRLKNNHPERVLLALKPYLEKEGFADSEAPVRAAYRYIKNRIDQLDYAGAIEQDLPIGSGLIESGHRHVLQKRLKIAGAWWKIENADCMAQLRVCRANNLEEKYWRQLKKAA